MGAWPADHTGTSKQKQTMKSRFLFPNSCKKWGWILTIPALVLGFCTMFIDDFAQYLPWLNVNLPGWFIGADFLQEGRGGPFTHNLLPELIVTFLSAGLVLIAFSKEKVEDERISQIRLESLQWGVLINVLYVVLATVLVYGGSYLSVLVYNMFTPLLFFIIRFNWILYVQPRWERKEAL